MTVKDTEALPVTVGALFLTAVWLVLLSHCCASQDLGTVALETMRLSCIYFIYFRHMGVFLEYVCVPYAYNAHGDQKAALDHLDWR